jgi:hypothetical protein
VGVEGELVLLYVRLAVLLMCICVGIETRP